MLLHPCCPTIETPQNQSIITSRNDVQRINLLEHGKLIVIGLIGLGETCILLRPRHATIIASKENKLEGDRILSFACSRSKPFSIPAQRRECVFVSINFCCMSYRPMYLSRSEAWQKGHRSD